MFYVISPAFISCPSSPTVSYIISPIIIPVRRRRCPLPRTRYINPVLFPPSPSNPPPGLRTVLLQRSMIGCVAMYYMSVFYLLKI